jgi:streptogramin lyase
LGSTLAGNQPAGIVVTAGSVWVTNSGDATVQRFSAETFRQGPLRTFNVASRPTGIVFAHGAIWVANAGDGVVTRIDPSSGATQTISVAAGPTALASTPDAVWVAGARTLSRIDPTTNEVRETIDIGNVPAGIAAADGFLWVTAQAP